LNRGRRGSARSRPGGRSSSATGSAWNSPDDLHVFEQQLAAAAVFDQRVLLADAHPVDTFAQVVHVFEVLHPEVVEDLQVNIALDFAHDFGRKGCFAGRVQFAASVFKHLLELVGVGVEQAVQRLFVERKYFADDVFELVGGGSGEVASIPLASSSMKILMRLLMSAGSGFRGAWRRWPCGGGS
jgi:hypothetical protein